MTNFDYPEPVSKLITLGDCRQMRQWPDYLALRIGPEHIPELIRMIQDEELNQADSESLEVWTPVHAWRALGQLRAEAATDSLIGLLEQIDEEYDEWIGEEVPEVLGTADPVTPPANARRLVSHLADGYLIIEEGGPHILFGWGNACVDDLVTAFLVDDVLPQERETTCEGTVVDEYVPLAPADAADLVDPLEAMVSLHTQILYLPEYYYWDVETKTAVGCPFGGRLTFEPSEEGERFTLEGCAFSEGFVVTGQGTYAYNDDEDLFSLEVSVTGLKEGQLVYTSQGDGSLQVSGTYDGANIELSE